MTKLHHPKNRAERLRLKKKKDFKFDEIQGRPQSAEARGFEDVRKQILSVEEEES